MWFARSAFIENVVAYRATLDAWGLKLIIWQISTIGEAHFSTAYAAMIRLYHAFGTVLLITATVCVGIIARTFRLTPSQIAAATLSPLLLLAPGLGVQYLTSTPMERTTSLRAGSKCSTSIRRAQSI